MKILIRITQIYVGFVFLFVSANLIGFYIFGVKFFYDEFDDFKWNFFHDTMFLFRFLLELGFINIVIGLIFVVRHKFFIKDSREFKMAIILTLIYGLLFLLLSFLFLVIFIHFFQLPIDYGSDHLLPMFQ